MMVIKSWEDIRNEFIGIVNYSIITLIQIEKGFSDEIDMSISESKIITIGL